MPELPEVETIVRDLRAAVSGRVLRRVAVVGHGEVVRHPDPHEFAGRATGATVRDVTRRGKFIVCALDSGDDLVVHLGMTGHLWVCAPAETPRPHTHIRIDLDDGRELRFADTRRFGRVLLGPRDRLTALGVLPPLGVEPLSDDFTTARFDALMRRTTRTVKAALLDQRGIAGLGNIYVDEICHRAGVRPTRRCHRLTRRERMALHDAVPVVLRTAIANRGSSIDDYRDVWNARGTHQERLQVYGRAGQACYACGTRLRHTVVSGRGTTYCPRCQR